MNPHFFLVGSRIQIYFPLIFETWAHAHLTVIVIHYEITPYLPFGKSNIEPKQWWAL